MRATILLLLAAAAPCPLATAQSQPANVLLIVADDMGTDGVGCYGNPSAPPTPVLDQLAGRGVRFSCAIVNPACSPTRAAMLTGRYGFRNGTPYSVLPNMPGNLSLGPYPTETTLPQALAPTNYSTALIGKWHLGTRYGITTPNQYGWGHFAGILDSGVPDYFQWTKVVNGQALATNTYATSEIVNDAIQWIGQQTRPWVLQVAFNAPHAPFQAPPANLHTQDLTGLSPSTSPQAFYKAMVQAMDTEIGRMLGAIPAATLANTNVIFVGDNGMDPALASGPINPERVKGSLYDRGSRVPLLVAGPAVVGANRVCPSIVSGVDLFATVLDLCAAPPPATVSTQPLDGVTLRPLLQGSAAAVRDHAYIDMLYSSSGGGYAIRNERYELLRIQANQPERMEFYDLQSDPYETNNLLRGTMSATVRAVFDRFFAQLEAIRPDGYCESIGAGCAGSAGVPRMRSQTSPTVGENFFFHIDNVPAQSALSIAVFGFSNIANQGVPLPFSLGQVGMPGCNLLVSTDVFLAVGYQNFGVIPIPAFASYNGLRFYLQGFSLDPGINAIGASASSALYCVIGS